MHKCCVTAYTLRFKEFDVDRLRNRNLDYVAVTCRCCLRVQIHRNESTELWLMSC